MFTLGNTPFPGFPSNHLGTALIKGMRLEKPKYCNDQMIKDYGLGLRIMDYDKYKCYETLYRSNTDTTVVDNVTAK
ncbi:hypothetical protein Anas_14743 [Armadillidium nasatum]|uniref:Uncharacterized protein n=1 Tax=Armadillidium nasatum TaxID=96803 RepID=A0A5N5TBF3_9CRUS|nr:hypothetical protein Anas_14743 [Armadillidium nasatum]